MCENIRHIHEWEYQNETVFYFSWNIHELKKLDVGRRMTKVNILLRACDLGVRRFRTNASQHGEMAMTVI
jgi:hypothetical protein